MENDIIPKEETSVSPKKAEKGGFSDMTNKIRENPWILSSLVLGIFVLVLVVPAMGMTGNVVSEKVEEVKTEEKVEEKVEETPVSPEETVEKTEDKAPAEEVKEQVEEKK